MKKAMVVGLTTLTLVGVVGFNKPTEAMVDNGKSLKNVVLTTNEVSKAAPVESYVGKVSSIEGNKVKVKLISSDLELTDKINVTVKNVELSEEQTKKLEAGETIQLADGSTMGVAIVGDAPKEEKGNFELALPAPAINTEDLKEQGIEIKAEGKGNNESVFNQMEFNGESKEFTIQSGVPLYNGVTGEEMKVSDIKKDSVVEFLIDEKTNTMIRVDVRN